MRISDWSSDVCSSDLAGSSFFAAYALGDASLEVRSLFGMTSGNLVPTSAALIKESTVIEFTRPDWGLPGVAMPRIVIYGPYPTATAAVTAVLGTLALQIGRAHV